MDIDRGVLARIDRKLLAGLGQSEVFRMARVPVATAKWWMWKRHWGSVGISMGRAIVALIDHELSTVFGDTQAECSPVPHSQPKRRWRDGRRKSPAANRN